MDVREFFAAVLPWEGKGFCCIQLLREGTSNHIHRYAADIDGFLKLIADANASVAKLDMWFSLCRLDRTGRRKLNFKASRALYADLDVKSGAYKDIYHAVHALRVMCESIGLPMPSAMVCSGHGLHVYWYSDRDLSINLWTLYSKGLRKLLKDAAIHADLQVTSNAVALLRIPGTINYKEPDDPKPVYLLPSASTGLKHDFAQMLGGLKLLEQDDRLDNVIPLPLRNKQPSLTKGMGSLKVDLDIVMKGCAWLREVHAKGGEGEPEPLWHDAVRCATYIENGERRVHELSNKHKGYDPDQCDIKYEQADTARKEQNLGWPSCATIEGNGCRHCATCEWRKDNKSPLNLGLPGHRLNYRDQIEALGGTVPPELRLPPGHGIDEDGQLCVLEAVSKTRNILLPLIRNRIRDVSYQHYGEQPGLSFAIEQKPGEWHYVFTGAGDAHGGGAATRLARQCVSIDANKVVKARVDSMVMSWLDVLRKEATMFRDAGLLGWRHENGKLTGFVYGGQMYRIGGGKISAPAYGDNEFRRWYLPTGKREPWIKAMRLLTDRKRPELDVLISVAFAAPLMVHTGATYGSILSVWGDPGTSKSTAQQVAAAVWGHPKQTRESLNSTPKSVQGRLGRIRNLPGYWDDIQTQTHQEALANTMFVVAGGTEGGRLTAEADYRERKEWQTLLVCCANTSFVEYMTSTQRSTTAGMRRVFEFRFQKKPDEVGLVDGLEANRAFAELEHNFGVIGQEYVHLLVTKHDQVVRLLTENVRRFVDRVEGTAEESFWWSTCGALITGAMLARTLGARMDYVTMEKFLVDVFKANREIRMGEGTEGGSLLNTENALGAYLNTYKNTGQALYTDTLFQNKHIQVNVKSNNMSQPKAIMFQVAVNERRIVIPKRTLREFLNERKLAVRQILDGLKTHYGSVERKLSIGAGTIYGQAQETCLEIPVGHNSMMEAILVAHGMPKPHLVVPSSNKAQ